MLSVVLLQSWPIADVLGLARSVCPCCCCLYMLDAMHRACLRLLLRFGCFTSHCSLQSTSSLRQQFMCRLHAH